MKRDSLEAISDKFCKISRNNTYHNDDYDVVSYIIAPTLVPPLNHIAKIKFTDLKSPKLFYLQCNLNEIQFQIIGESMQSYYNYIQKKCQNKFDFSKLKVGDVVAALFDEDNCWYRARVESFTSDSCDIFYIDYGNYSTVKNDHLQDLINLFAKLSPQAIPCCIDNLQDWPANFDTENYFLSEAYCKFVEFKDGVYSVVLYKDDKTLLFDHIQPQPIHQQSISTVQLKFDETMDVILKYSYSPKSFFVQLRSQSSIHNLCEEEMQMFYNSLDLKSKVDEKSLKKGDVIACRFKEDDRWYRARIESLDLKSQKVKVFYLDYGNTEETMFDHVRTLDSKFLSTSIQAIECVLDNIEEWPNDFVDKHYHFLCKFKQKNDPNNSYLVELYDSETKMPLFPSVLSSDTSNHNNEHINTCNNSAAKLSNGIDKSYVRKILFTDLPKCHLNLNQKYLVKLSQISTPECFYVHLADCDDYKQLEFDLQKYYQRNDSSEIKIKADDLKKGLIFGCQYLNDVWYRAKIIDINQAATPNETKFTVFFIDFGNIEVTTLDRMRYLDDKFIKLETKSVKCYIKGLNSWPNGFEDKYSFENVICEFMELNISNDSYFVNLYSDTDELLVKPKESDQSVNGKSTSSNVSNDFHSKLKLVSEIPELKKQVVKLTNLSSPQSFYCRLASHEEKYQTFDKQLQTHYSAFKNKDSLNLILDKAKIGSFVVCRHLTNQNYYRSQILKKDEEKAKLKVIYIDHGIEAEVQMDQVKLIEDQFLTLSSQAIHCKIKGIEAWPSGFEHKLMLKNVIADFIDMDQKDKAYFVKLFDNETQDVLIGEECLNNSKLEKAVSKSIQYVKPILNFKQAIIKLVYLPNPKSFWVRIDSMNNRYEELEEELQTCYNRTEDNAMLQIDSNSIDVNDFIVCQYQVDDQWYRAKVLSKDSKSFKVKYIDYGNEEECPFDRARVMSEKFKDLKAQALQCCIESIEKWPAGFEENYLYTNTNCEFIKTIEADDGSTKYFTKLYDLNTKDDLFPTKAVISKITPQLNTRCNIFLTELSSPASFYCQLRPEDANFREMGELMQTYIDNNLKMLKVNLNHVKVKDYVAALFDEDSCYYRAQIESINEEDEKCKVFFIDYGNQAWVSLEKMFKLDERFKHVPSQAINCSIKELDKWPDKFVDDYYFENIECIFKQKDDNDLYLIDLLDEEARVKLESQLEEPKFLTNAEKKDESKESKEVDNLCRSESIQIEISPELGDYTDKNLGGQDTQILIQFDDEPLSNEKFNNTSHNCLLPDSAKSEANHKSSDFESYTQIESEMNNANDQDQDQNHDEHVKDNIIELESENDSNKLGDSFGNHRDEEFNTLDNEQND